MILFDHVTKFYPGDKNPALDDISLHIEPNEFVFVVGKSGAGKSTLIKMITKEDNQTSGKIIVGGIDLDYVKKRYIPHYRRRLGVVFQDYKLLPNRTVYENVAFALEIAGMSKKEIAKTVPKVLDLVNLSHKGHKFPRNLSGGERQRVAIARSVARQPKILIADEPTGNLDVVTTREIIGLLQKINDFGTTVVVTTHDENVVNNLHKRVITIKDGRIIRDQKENGIYRLDQSYATTARRTTNNRYYKPADLTNLSRKSTAVEPLDRSPRPEPSDFIEAPVDVDDEPEIEETPAVRRLFRRRGKKVATKAARVTSAKAAVAKPVQKQIVTRKAPARTTIKRPVRSTASVAVPSTSRRRTTRTTTSARAGDLMTDATKLAVHRTKTHAQPMQQNGKVL